MEADTKTCTICGEVQLIEEFYLSCYVRKDGTRARESVCNACQAKRMRFRRSEEGKAVIATKAAKKRDQGKRGVKTCTECNEEKPVEEFNFKSHICKDGTRARASQCKTCQAKDNRCWREKNPEKVKEHSRRFYKDHSEQVKEYQRRYCEENRVRVALRMSCADTKRRRSGFPCDPSQESEIAAAFTGKCHFCGMTEEDSGRKLCIDHDHSIEFSNFRGWLCNPCNVRDVLATKKEK